MPSWCSDVSFSTNMRTGCTCLFGIDALFTAQVLQPSGRIGSIVDARSQRACPGHTNDVPRSARVPLLPESQRAPSLSIEFLTCIAFRLSSALVDRFLQSTELFQVKVACIYHPESIPAGKVRISDQRRAQGDCDPPALTLHWRSSPWCLCPCRAPAMD